MLGCPGQRGLQEQKDKDVMCEYKIKQTASSSACLEGNGSEEEQ